MINMEDDRGSREEERSEAKTDFGGLRETTESRDHRECVGGAEVRRRRGGESESGGTN